VIASFSFSWTAYFPKQVGVIGQCYEGHGKQISTLSVYLLCMDWLNRNKTNACLFCVQKLKAVEESKTEDFTSLFDWGKQVREQENIEIDVFAFCRSHE
jgi:hypothetical protein